MQDIKQPIVDLITRIRLIQVFPCFTNLSHMQCEEFASIMQEITYNTQTIIVKEDELIDSIYIIVNGTAEVTQQTSDHSIVPIATLTVGEAIGLSDTGFYSTTGKRTATVTAVTAMLVLRLTIKDLYDFLKKHQLESSLYASSLQMLRMQLIKQSLPFSKLSHERLQWLAKQVEEVHVPAGTILFHQGDKGDQSYLIRTGQVAIYVEDIHHQERLLGLLDPPILFGEATLITRAPRNATAKVVKDCELLIIRHDCLSELLAAEQDIATMFMTLTVDRSRPLQNPHVTIHHRIAADGQKIIILKNPDHSNYFKLSTEGYFIWQQLDGHHTLQDITLALVQKHQVFAPNIVVALISKLIMAGFVANYHPEEKIQLTSLPVWKKIAVVSRQLLSKRFTFGDANWWLSGIYNYGIHYLFTTLGQIILSVFILVGFVLFIMHTESVLFFLHTEHVHVLLLLLTLIPFSIMRTILHELGHAFAVKAFGYEVHRMGIGWSGIRPIAFTDTSDMWLAARVPRMIVSLAGVYADVLTAGLFSFLIVVISHPYLQSVLWLFALYTYIGAFNKLSPLQETDGYYALMDYLEKTHLREKAVIWLVNWYASRSVVHLSHSLKENKPEVYYWILCISYLVAVSLLTFFLQELALYAFKIISLNIYISLVIPFLVVILSSLKIIIEIRQKSEE